MCFWCLHGRSFNLFVVPSNLSEEEDDQDRERFRKNIDSKLEDANYSGLVFFDQERGDWKIYQAWKKTLVGAHLNQVKAYETDFKEKCKLKGGGFRILVFEMTPGRRLIFDAKQCFHGTVVPPNTTRCLLVLHELDLVWGTYVSSNDPQFKAGRVEVSELSKVFPEWRKHTDSSGLFKGKPPPKGS